MTKESIENFANLTPEKKIEALLSTALTDKAHVSYLLADEVFDVALMHFVTAKKSSLIFSKMIDVIEALPLKDQLHLYQAKAQQRLPYKFKIVCVAIFLRLDAKHHISFIFGCLDMTTFSIL